MFSWLQHQQPSTFDDIDTNTTTTAAYFDSTIYIICSLRRNIICSLYYLKMFYIFYKLYVDSCSNDDIQTRACRPR